MSLGNKLSLGCSKMLDNKDWPCLKTSVKICSDAMVTREVIKTEANLWNSMKFTNSRSCIVNVNFKGIEIKLFSTAWGCLHICNRVSRKLLNYKQGADAQSSGADAQSSGAAPSEMAVWSLCLGSLGVRSLRLRCAGNVNNSWTSKTQYKKKM